MKIREVIAQLSTRAGICEAMVGCYPEHADKERCRGKAKAYRHAAEILAAELSTAVDSEVAQ